MRAFASESEYWRPTGAKIASTQALQRNPSACPQKTQALNQLSSSPVEMKKESYPTKDVKRVPTFREAATAQPSRPTASRTAVEQPPALKLKGMTVPLFSNRMGGNVKTGGGSDECKFQEDVRNQGNPPNRQHPKAAGAIETQINLKASKDPKPSKTQKELTVSKAQKQSQSLYTQEVLDSQEADGGLKAKEERLGGVKGNDVSGGKGSQSAAHDSDTNKSSLGSVKVVRVAQKRPTEALLVGPELLSTRAGGSVVTSQGGEEPRQKEPGRKRLRRMHSCFSDDEDAAVAHPSVAVNASQTALAADDGALHSDNRVVTDPMESELNSFWEQADACEPVVEPTGARETRVASTETTPTTQPVVRVKVTMERKSKKGKYTVVDTVEEMQDVAAGTKSIAPACSKLQGSGGLTRIARQQSKLSSFFAMPNGK